MDSDRSDESDFAPDGRGAKRPGCSCESSTLWLGLNWLGTVGPNQGHPNDRGLGFGSFSGQHVRWRFRLRASLGIVSPSQNGSGFHLFLTSSFRRLNSFSLRSRTKRGLAVAAQCRFSSALRSERQQKVCEICAKAVTCFFVFSIHHTSKLSEGQLMVHTS